MGALILPLGVLLPRSIAQQGTAKAHANRALAFIKLNKHSDAIADCTAALRLDAMFLKAWQRRASAHHALGRHRQALADIEEALRYAATSACICLVLADNFGF